MKIFAEHNEVYHDGETVKITEVIYCDGRFSVAVDDDESHIIVLDRDKKRSKHAFLLSGEAAKSIMNIIRDDVPHEACDYTIVLMENIIKAHGIEVDRIEYATGREIQAVC